MILGWECYKNKKEVFEVFVLYIVYLRSLLLFFVVWFLLLVFVCLLDRKCIVSYLLDVIFCLNWYCIDIGWSVIEKFDIGLVLGWKFRNLFRKLR